ncbi:MAG: hypothetical protein MZU97_02760 [Bacillus subtilis]|nr:hypothetical protein [Bacillus subtilis]
MQGRDVAIAIMDFAYMGGSMGGVVGEKVTRLIEEGIEENSNYRNYFFRWSKDARKRS